MAEGGRSLRINLFIVAEDNLATGKMGRLAGGTRERNEIFQSENCRG